ncbi:hypothetical protein BD779DRAFT_1479155, partial [Infundibulicybe gibba]
MPLGKVKGGHYMFDVILCLEVQLVNGEGKLSYREMAVMEIPAPRARRSKRAWSYSGFAAGRYESGRGRTSKSGENDGHWLSYYFRAQISLQAAAACSLWRVPTFHGSGNFYCHYITTHEPGLETSNDKPTKSKYHKRVVSTLDPLHLQPSDFVDLSSVVGPILTLPGMKSSKQKPRIACHYHGIRVRPPFPNNTRGFFHYYHPPGLPFTASGLRFRVMPGMDVSPANFDAGEDLLLPLGVPWQVPFPKIAMSSFAKDLRDYLL